MYNFQLPYLRILLHRTNLELVRILKMLNGSNNIEAIEEKWTSVKNRHLYKHIYRANNVTGTCPMSTIVNLVACPCLDNTGICPVSTMVNLVACPCWNVTGICLIYISKRKLFSMIERHSQPHHLLTVCDFLDDYTFSSSECCYHIFNFPLYLFLPTYPLLLHIQVLTTIYSF